MYRSNIQNNKLPRHIKMRKNKIEKFKTELLKLLEKYQYSISHEDSHGGFILESFNECDNNHLLDFSISYKIIENENPTQDDWNKKQQDFFDKFHDGMENYALEHTELIEYINSTKKPTNKEFYIYLEMNKNKEIQK